MRLSVHCPHGPHAPHAWEADIDEGGAGTVWDRGLCPGLTVEQDAQLRDGRAPGTPPRGLPAVPATGRGSHEQERYLPASLPTPEVDLAAVRGPGGRRWERTEHLLNRAAGQRPSGAEQVVRDSERDRCARRVEAWAASLPTEHDRLVAIAAAEVIRGGR